MLIAHRGGSGLFLENSLAAFEHAIAAGCDGAELDVHLSADGALVVHHDPILNHQYTKTPAGRWLRPLERRAIAALTLAEIRRYRIGQPNPHSDYGRKFPDLAVIEDQPVPTLAEVIELVRQRSSTFRLVIEIKSACLFAPRGRCWQPLVDAVLAELERLQFTERAILCGFDWRALRYAKQCQPRIPLWLNTHPFAWRDGERAAPADLPVSRAMRAMLRAADAAGTHWQAGFRPASAAAVPRAVRAAGGDLWFAYYTDCSQAAIAQA
ncbi:MAG TPA: glycerophosphodiester phosphodiesterase family protein, partial [Salinisphaeraceae bacterium]|nr:glycerophosphodiester phosphodiesterase family protein [Salinisphaeraceae bacterium]